MLAQLNWIYFHVGSHITIDTKHERKALTGKMLVIVINIYFIHRNTKWITKTMETNIPLNPTSMKNKHLAYATDL